MAAISLPSRDEIRRSIHNSYIKLPGINSSQNPKKDALESYYTLYQAISTPQKSFSKQEIPERLDFIHRRVNDLIRRIKLVFIDSRSQAQANLLSTPPYDLPPISFNAELKNTRLPHLDLHSTILEDFSKTLHLHSEEELLSHLQEAKLFITTPLEAGIEIYQPDESLCLKLRTHFFFHNCICGNPINYGQKLGKGSYGEITQATLGKMSFASKQLLPIDYPKLVAQWAAAGESILTEEEYLKCHQISFNIEICSLLKLNHPNIIQLLAVHQNIMGPILCLELAHETLHQFILRQPALPNNFRQIAPELRLKIFTQITSAVVHIHQKGIVHKDLTSTNVLLTMDGTIKVSDFGLTTIYNASQSNAICAEYSPPESMLQGRGHISPKCDVWAIGVLLCLSFISSFPYPRKVVKNPTPHGISSRKETDYEYRTRCHNQLYLQPTHITDPDNHWGPYDPARFWRTLIERCLNGNPELRPSSKEVLEYLKKA